MSADLYSGDPKIILTEDGAEMVFRGGQPVMDQGWENYALMSLLTGIGWAGNVLLPPESRIGSKYEELGNKSITLSNIHEMRSEANNALKNDSFGEILTEITNPSSKAYVNRITISAPNGLIDELTIIKNSQNWIQQVKNPANEKV